MRSRDAQASNRTEQVGQALRGQKPAGNAGLVAVAIAALLLGALVYLVDRTPGHSLLIPVAGALSSGLSFGALARWLPSFVHPLAFGLFTATLLPARPGWRVGGCALWGAVNAAFELGQHSLVSASLAAKLLGDAGAAAAPWRQALAGYFVAGTFDNGDLVAIVLGTALAVLVLHAASGGRETFNAS
jgi:hypothetical protein